MAKIKFKIDNENKTVTFYFKYGTFKKVAEEILKISKTDTDIQKTTHIATRNITYILTQAMKVISKEIGLDILSYKPNLVQYKKKYELPIELRKR